VPFSKKPEPCDEVLVQVGVVGGEPEIRQLLEINDYREARADAPSSVQALKVQLVRSGDQRAGSFSVSGDMTIVVVSEAAAVGLHPGHALLQFFGKPQVVRIQKRDIFPARTFQSLVAGLSRAAPFSRTKKAHTRVGCSGFFD